MKSIILEAELRSKLPVEWKKKQLDNLIDLVCCCSEQ